MKSVLFCSLLLILPWSSAAQQGTVFNPDQEKRLIEGELQRYSARLIAERADVAADDNVDITYYGIRLTINTDPNGVAGVVTVRGRSVAGNLDEVRLDLTAVLTVDSVLTPAHHLSFARGGDVVTVTLDSLLGAGEEFAFDVAYHGVPNSSGFGSFTFGQYNGMPWIYTLSEPYGAKDWWPCKDHPLDKADSVDMFVTCDSTLRVGSNGTLVSVVGNGDGTSTTHWKERYPISSYLVSITIHPFAEFSNWFHYAPGDSMEILNYVRQDHLSSAQAALPKTVQMLEIYSDLFGLYPFVSEKYGHADFGWGGAMEHQTMTSTTTYDEGTIAHELGHQWFGDMITCASWPDLWLNEGFATYLAGLYFERRYGPATFRSYMLSQQNSALTAPGTLYLQDTASVGNMFNGSRVYAKGASVLHMLRYVLGDSGFFKAMYAYANDPALRYATAGTADFQRNCESSSGRDLDWFFNQWVYGEKYPVYTYGWTARPDGGGVRVDLRMVQETNTINPAAFRMPMDVAFHGAGLDTTIVVTDSLSTQDFVFQLPASPDSIALDPSGWNLQQETRVPYALLFGFSNTIQVLDRWNIVSVPYAGGEPRTSVLFPTAVSDAYGYSPDSGYSSRDTLRNGEGYWMKFAGDQSVSIPGDPFISDTIDVEEGWNLVGSVSLPVDVETISSVPPGLATGYFYGYDGGYLIEQVITPGRGYWVRASQSGQLVLEGAGSAPPASRIRIRDTGELPPSPPPGDGVTGTDVPLGYRLFQNSPNPFNPTTTITYILPITSHVTLEVCDLLGRVIATLVDETQSASLHRVRWDAAGVPGGVYFCRLRAGDYTRTMKMAVIR